MLKIYLKRLKQLFYVYFLTLFKLQQQNTITNRKTRQLTAYDDHNSIVNSDDDILDVMEEIFLSPFRGLFSFASE